MCWQVEGNVEICKRYEPTSLLCPSDVPSDSILYFQAPVLDAVSINLHEAGSLITDMWEYTKVGRGNKHMWSQILLDISEDAKPVLNI